MVGRIKSIFEVGHVLTKEGLCSEIEMWGVGLLADASRNTRVCLHSHR